MKWNVQSLSAAAGEEKFATLFSPSMIAAATAIVWEELPDSTFDLSTATGNDVLLFLDGLSEEERGKLLSREIDSESIVTQGTDEQDVDMTEVLADVDKRGKSIRPFIAAVMAGLLVLTLLGYTFLIGKISYEANTPPAWEYLIIPFGIPLTIVWSYFGFLRAERKEFLETVLRNTPVGTITGAVGAKMVEAAKRIK